MAVAQSVLDGPDSYLRTGLGEARARDAATARHATKVNALVAEAARTV